MAKDYDAKNNQSNDLARPREDGFVNIVTHDGDFHADEVFAVASLPFDYTITRTRDPQKIKEADMRIDVGGEYNPEGYSFDHHQKGGAGVRENGVPYASFGLVWKHFGRNSNGCYFSEDPGRLQKMIDEEFVQKIDATDTGHSSYNNEGPYPLHYGIAAFNSFYDESQDEAFEAAVEAARWILRGVAARCERGVQAEDVVWK